MKPGLTKFCVNEIPVTDQNISISKLVESQSCPPFLLPSTPHLGKCIPTVILNTTTKIKTIKKEDGKSLNWESLVEGKEYVLESIDTRPHLEKLFTYVYGNLWIFLILFMLTMVLSLILIHLFK